MSKVISIRVSDEIYNMLQFCYSEEKKQHDKACKEFKRAIYNPMASMSFSEYGKIMFCNAVGARYTEFKNNDSVTSISTNEVK